MLAEAGVVVKGLHFAGLSPGAESGVLPAPSVAVATSETLGPAPGVEFRGEVESVKSLTYHFLVSVTQETLRPVSSLKHEGFPRNAC